MLYQVLNLRKQPTKSGYMPTLTTYILDSIEGDGKRPAVIVFPGGGYQFTSHREAERIALAYNAAGYHAFVLRYSVAPDIHPEPILDAAKAFTMVREHAQDWMVDTDKIAVCGFSAGGHLAASLSVHWNNNSIFTDEEIQNGLLKPNASILCYPVITVYEYAHQGSFSNLFGRKPDPAFLDLMSLENHVGKHTPPAFLWHTTEDVVVPVQNSLVYAQALAKEQIPFEMHIFPNGPHGLSLVSDETVWSVPKYNRNYDWLEKSVDWLNETFGLR